MSSGRSKTLATAGGRARHSVRAAGHPQNDPTSIGFHYPRRARSDAPYPRRGHMGTLTPPRSLPPLLLLPPRQTVVPLLDIHPSPDRRIGMGMPESPDSSGQA